MEMKRLFQDFTHIPLMVVRMRWSGFLSSTTFTDTVQKVKIIDKETAVTSKYKGEMVSVGEAIAEYFDRRGFKKHLMNKACFSLAYKLPPLHCEPGTGRGRWSYLDLRSAFPAIYTRMRWGDEFVPGKWARRDATEAPLSDFPYLENKLARNALIGMARGGKLHYYDTGSYRFSRPTWTYVNYHMVGAIMAILHDIAHHAVTRCNCRYWNTDGGILEHEDGLRLVEYCRETWALELREKLTGEIVIIRAPGDYSVGEHKTLVNARRNRQLTKVIPVSGRDVDRLRWLIS